jgi:hypothetical protein
MKMQKIARIEDFYKPIEEIKRYVNRYCKNCDQIKQFIDSVKLD